MTAELALLRMGHVPNNNSGGHKFHVKEHKV
eukprot:CAMPEP_0201585336 /NCGR_PEP_ID=MMETSP0190_2-20130828/120618_1 /ASSEMBLY_ACC=CAM_ASM_000263 /TAXON_ID=37353 /ORGANISM="Rosalina sp." /LENGTH=30 /DNA_ID= /DNA_START= /DNA_END= /DNA_ORIENTATION=